MGLQIHPNRHALLRQATYPGVVLYISIAAGATTYTVTGSVVVPSSGAGVTALSQTSVLTPGYVLASTDQGVFKCAGDPAPNPRPTPSYNPDPGLGLGPGPVTLTMNLNQTVAHAVSLPGGRVRLSPPQGKRAVHCMPVRLLDNALPDPVQAPTGRCLWAANCGLCCCCLTLQCCVSRKLPTA